MRTTKFVALILLLSFFITGCNLNNQSDNDDPIIATPISLISVDVQAATLDGALTLNNGMFPNGGLEYGELWSQGSHANDRFRLGNTYGSNYSAMLIHGNYDLSYQFKAGGLSVPSNTNAVVSSAVSVTADKTQNVDVPMITVSGSFTLNGNPFLASIYNSAQFYLQKVGTNEKIFFGDSHLPPAQVSVTPGQYHVIYDYRMGDLVPINVGARVMANVDLTSNQMLAVNVAAHQLRPSITLNSAAFPINQYADANIVLLDKTTGAESTLFNTHDPKSTLLVVSGTYDVLYRHETGGAIVPLNSSARLAENFVFNTGRDFVHNIVTIEVDMNVTHNGVPFLINEYLDGNLYLHDAATNADTHLGNTHDGFSNIILIPGTYDFYYSHETGDGVPQNIRGLVKEGVVINSPSLNLDVVSHLVHVNLTLNGEAFAKNQYVDANIYLAGPQSTEAMFVGNTHDGPLSIRVLPGTYDLIYRHETGESVPQNNNYRVLKNRPVSGETYLSANIRSKAVRLSATLNGAAFPANQNTLNGGRIYASSGEGERVLLLKTHTDSSTTVVLAEGVYDFFYEYAGGNDVPRNAWVKIGSTTLQ